MRTKSTGAGIVSTVSAGNSVCSASLSPVPSRSCDLIEPSGFDYLDAAKQKYGNRIILLTAHLGAWELTSFAFSFLGHQMTIPVRRIDNPRIEQFIDRYRTRFGNTTRQTYRRPSDVQILRSGERHIGLLPDLNTLDDEAIFIDFSAFLPQPTSSLQNSRCERTRP